MNAIKYVKSCLSKKKKKANEGLNVSIEVGNNSFLGQGSGENRPSEFQYYATERKWHAQSTIYTSFHAYSCLVNHYFHKALYRMDNSLFFTIYVEMWVIKFQYTDDAYQIISDDSSYQWKYDSSGSHVVMEMV